MLRNNLKKLANMKRRKALSRIGLSLGYAAAAPTLFSILQSCQTEENKTTWNPIFFDEKQAVVIDKITELILPKTDLPGASELNIPKFIDLSFAELLSDEEKATIRKGCVEATSILEKDNFTTEACDKLLNTYFNAPKEKQEDYLNSINKGTFNNPEVLVYNFLNKVRGNTIWAYKNSEYIGEKVLVYDPVPGPFQGCINWDNKLGYSL